MSISPGRTVRANLNVTPLVDVVLVLLIVFLVAAPVLLRQHEVDLPPADAGGAIEPPLEIAVHGDGSVTIDAAGHPTTVMLVDLAAAARPILTSRPGRIVVLDVDDELPFAIAVQTIDTLRGAGGDRVVLGRREPR